MELLNGSETGSSAECGIPADSVSCPNDSCSNITGSDTAGFAADNSRSAGCFPQSRSSVAQLNSPHGMTSAGDSCESLSYVSARRNVAKLSVDVPPSVSTTASDLPNTSRSVEF